MIAGAQPLLLVGAGKMGGAMLEQWLASGLTASDVTILDPYLEGDRWAALADSDMPVGVSLGILDGVHARWSVLWATLDERAFARTFHHPEMGTLSLDRNLQLYAWHSRHHVAHITALRSREGW